MILAEAETQDDDIEVKGTKDIELAVFAVFDEQKSRKIEFLVNRIKEIIPFYVNIRFI